MDHWNKSGTEEDSLPEYHVDCCFSGNEGGQKLTILVVIEKRSKMKKAVVVPLKPRQWSYRRRVRQASMQ